MAKSYPETIPAEFMNDETLTDAYKRGWNHGHGIACHNVPRLGDKLFVDDMGRVVVDAENIREVHQSLCYSAESNSRQYSPFEFTAHEFNSADCDDSGEFDPEKEGTAESLWEAFDAGINDAIQADLAGYSDDDYGLNDVD